MRTHLLWIVLTAGCGIEDTRTGTSVGNPGEAAVRVAPGKGTYHRSGELPVTVLTLMGCDGDASFVPISSPLDLFAPGATISLPAGRWCSLSLDTDGPLQLSGDDGQGHTYDLELEIGVIELAAPGGVDIAGGAFILELGHSGWLDAQSLGLTYGDVVVGPDSPLHDALASAIASRSTLFLDRDGDSRLDDVERAAGPLAGQETPEDDGDTAEADAGQAALQVAPGSWTTHRSGTLPIGSLRLTSCAGESQDLPVDAPFDLFAAQPLVLPAGEWCALDLTPSGPLLLEGEGWDREYSFTLDVGVIAVAADEGLQIEGQAFILELGWEGWINPWLLDLDDQDAVIGPGDYLHDWLAETIGEGSGLYADADGDGALSDEEREVGSIASGPEHYEGW